MASFDPILVTYAALGCMAVVPVYFGSFCSVVKAGDEDNEEEKETLSLDDAKMFPVYASGSLLSLYLLFKFFDKNLINYLLTAYFVIIGIGALVSVALTASRAITGKELKGDYELTFKVKAKKAFDLTFGNYHIFLFVLSVIIAGAYVWTKHWIISNIYGEVFSIAAIELLKLDSFKTGGILLTGLFFYDIFWVFGTDVMVTVAKSFDAPIKVVWPKDIFELIAQKAIIPPAGTKFSLLGLGDIVLPGIYVALSLRFDYHRYLQTAAGKKNPKSSDYPKPYFYAAMIAYIVGLSTTMAVMHVFKAAQPALLYLSPACLLSTAIVATYLKEWKLVLSFSEESQESTEKEGAAKKSSSKAVEKTGTDELNASPKAPRSTTKKRGGKKSE